MRKSLIALALLLALAAGGAASAAVLLGLQAGRVTVTEHVLYGDAGAADGLLVEVKACCERHLHWDTQYWVGAPERTETRFRYTQEAESIPQETEYSGVSVNNMGELWGSSWSTSSTGDLADRDLSGVTQLYLDVAGRTQPGTEHTETVYWKDYYEFYPIYVSVDLPGFHYSPEKFNRPGWETELERQLRETFAAFFRVPVLEDDAMEITVRRNSQGDIVGSGMSGGNAINSVGTVAEGACYFTVDLHQNDQLLDTSRIPGGYGLYRLPYSMKEGSAVVRPEELAMVYPLEPENELIELKATADGKRVLLLTREQGVCWLTVLDGATAEQLQRLELTHIPEDSGVSLQIYDGFLVSLEGGERFTVLEERADGTYRQALAAAWPEDERFREQMLWIEPVMDWDGERLAAAFYPYHSEWRNGEYAPYKQVCGFYLCVWDGGGLRYVGRYDSSLDAPPGPMGQGYYSDWCEPVNGEGPELHWTS